MVKRAGSGTEKGADGGATPPASTEERKPGAAESPGEAAHPLVAAYAGGRLLNQLDWHVQQAWLLPAIDDFQAAQLHADAVHDILTGLSLNLRTALPAPAQGRFHDLFLGKRDEWDRLYGMPGHLVSVESTARWLAHELSQDGDYSPPVLREENWLDCLGSMMEFAPRLFELVESALDERCKLNSSSLTS